MLPLLASVDALEARLGVSLKDGALSRALAILADASALIRNETGQDLAVYDEDQAVDWGDLSAATVSLVESVCLAVAQRGYRNPDGVAQSSVGDVSVSYAREGIAGSIFLTREERTSLRRAVGRSSIGSIQLSTPYMAVSAGSDWLDTD